MKKNLKKIVLVFLALALTVSASACLFSCGKNGSSNTTGGTIPGDLPSDNGTVGGTTNATDGTTNGTVDGTTGVVTPPVNEGDYINLLTGLKTNNANADKLKPLAVVVDNVDAALAHQTGLTQADILYETLVAPGITRFTALVSDYSALKDICNIREAYMEHLDIVGSHNAILVAHGGASHLTDFGTSAADRFGGGTKDNTTTYGYINTFKDVAFTEEGGKNYGTIKKYTEETYRKDIPHDTLLTQSAVKTVFSSKYSLFLKSGASAEGKAQGFTFADGKVMNGAAATQVKIVFSAEGYNTVKNVSYVYDAQSGQYLRYQGTDTAHKDSVTGTQLAFTNVITLFTDVAGQKLSGENNIVTSTTVMGEGTGYYFYGGEAVEIKWSKSAWNGALTLTDKDGNALELARGTTYISYLDNTDTAKAVSFN